MTSGAWRKLISVTCGLATLVAHEALIEIHRGTHRINRGVLFCLCELVLGVAFRRDCSLSLVDPEKYDGDDRQLKGAMKYLLPFMVELVEKADENERSSCLPSRLSSPRW